MRALWRGTILGGIVVVAVAVAASGADLEAGKTIYGKQCQNCHGADGKGNPQIEKMLKKKIPDLTAVNLSTLSKTEHEQKLQEFRKVITDGKPPMPAFGKKLSKEEQEGVLEYIEKTFIKGGK